uniref:regulator of telomere elongation helicase 1-like isoform X3 n=1 Tax=Myxine glutinosa TaxID=7769 RepID=UPI00358EF1C3
MPKVFIRGIEVDFPFTPYKCQEDYMDRVITCLEMGQNGVLESPTGTGKTLCLLCAALAWREHRVGFQVQLRKEATALHGTLNGPTPRPSGGRHLSLDVSPNRSPEEMLAGYSEIPKIIFASRTHSQLSHAIGELGHTSYRPRTCVLGSREQFCIHPEVAKHESNHVKVHMCRIKTSARSCHFYNNLDKKKEEFRQTILDIEDLVKMAKIHQICPYYMSRELKQNADLLFMPYNYLLDPKSRKAHGIDLQGSIVIFDEAHNIEQMCEEVASFDLTPHDLASGIDAVTSFLELKVQTMDQHLQSGDLESSSPAVNVSVEDVAKIKKLLLNLEREIDAIQLPSSGGLTREGSFLLELFLKAGIDNQCGQLMQEGLGNIAVELANNGGVFNKLGELQKLKEVFEMAFSKDRLAGFAQRPLEKQDRCYKVHIHVDKSSLKKKADPWAVPSKNQGKVLSYWCFNPGRSMLELISQGIRCLILTSGTLTPLSSFTTELQINFPVQLENPHVIDQHQVWAGVVMRGPDNEQLNSSYQTRFTVAYMTSLGCTIANFCRIVPDGLLVFFPSYPVMGKCLEHWTETGLWKRIEGFKSIFVEPKGKRSFTEVVDGFYEKVQDSNTSGAAFFAVCRGKVSEGLDFADRNGRAVIVTGLPFPPMLDPRIMLKMQFLDELKSRRQKDGELQALTGQAWYRQQASRAVNQAIGRVIRHRFDYGAIILCDHRFGNPESLAQFPCWLRPRITSYTNFGNAVRELTQFFRRVTNLMPLPEPKKSRNSAHKSLVHPCVNSAASSAGLIPWKKASAPDCHVPSLCSTSRGCEEGGSLDQLCTVYEGQDSAGGVRTRGLLDALAQNENGDHRQALDNEKNEQRQNKVVEDRYKGIAKRLVVVTAKKPQSCSENMTKHDKARGYLVQVKCTLSHQNYGMFAKALRSYKETEELPALLNCLREIFGSDSRMHSLFRDFYGFVRPQHKQAFEAAYQSITRQGSGASVEDGESHVQQARVLWKPLQHPTENTTKEAPMKIRKIDPKGAMEKSKFGSHEQIGGLNSMTHLNHGGSHLCSGSERSKMFVCSKGPQVSDERQLPFGDQRLGGCTSYANGATVVLQKLREALKPDMFSHVDLALQNYKQTGDLEVMLGILASLLSQTPTTVCLLTAEFAPFVLPQHQGRFELLCGNLTGKSCHVEMKNDCTKEEPEPCCSGGVLHGLETRNEKRKAAATNLELNPLPPGSCQKEVQMEETKGCQEARTHSKEDPDPNTCRSDEEWSAIHKNRPAFCLEYDEHFGYKCLACQRTKGLFFACNACNAICCQDCWRSCIKEHLPCRGCGHRTKWRHLKQMFFPIYLPK